MARPIRVRTPAAISRLFVAAALWGGATTGTKYALRGFEPVTLLAVELVAAAVALAIVARVRGDARGTVPSWRLAGILGLLEPATAYLGETIGLQRTTAANAAVILGLESCFVVLLAAVFLRERIDAALGCAVVAGFAGLALLEGSGWLSGPGIGDAFVVCGTFSAAVYVIVARRMDASVDAVTLTLRQFTVAAAAVAPLALGSWASGRESVPTAVEPQYWVAAVAVGVAGYAASFLLYNSAIVFVEAGRAAVIINLIPAFGVASAVALLGERLGAHQLLGALLLTGSVAVFSWVDLRPRLRSDAPASPVEELVPVAAQSTSAL
jgi:drug/metabolite transporter (DMT)-like permease